jgi:hypothetical protein
MRIVAIRLLFPITLVLSFYARRILKGPKIPGCEDEGKPPTALLGVAEPKYESGDRFKLAGT